MSVQCKKDERERRVKTEVWTTKMKKCGYYTACLEADKSAVEKVVDGAVHVTRGHRRWPHTESRPSRKRTTPIAVHFTRHIRELDSLWPNDNATSSVAFISFCKIIAVHDEQPGHTSLDGIRQEMRANQCRNLSKITALNASTLPDLLANVYLSIQKDY